MIKIGDHVTYDDDTVFAVTDLAGPLAEITLWDDDGKFVAIVERDRLRPVGRVL